MLGPQLSPTFASSVHMPTEKTPDSSGWGTRTMRRLRFSKAVRIAFVFASRASLFAFRARRIRSSRSFSMGTLVLWRRSTTNLRRLSRANLAPAMVSGYILRPLKPTPNRKIIPDNLRSRCPLCGRPNHGASIIEWKIASQVLAAPWCTEILKGERACLPLTVEEYTDVDIQFHHTRLPQEGLRAFDAPVRPLVALLRANGIQTVFSCQGSGKRPGYIVLWHTLKGRNDPKEVVALLERHFPDTRPRASVFPSPLLGLMPMVHVKLTPHAVASTPKAKTPEQ